MTILIASAALAAWPEDPSITGMVEHGGVRVVDTERLAGDYEQLVRELGTVVGNKPVLPASTTGLYGFEFALTTTFVFLDATSRESVDGEPPISPWDRAVPDEDAESYLFVPTFSVRKGLPLSTEIGASVGWVGLTRTGTASAYGRVALVEGYAPLPDVTLQVGYAGYVGNDELELGVMDLGVTVGGRFGLGSEKNVHTGRIEPFGSFTINRVTALPVVDATTAARTGAVAYRGRDAAAKDPLVLPQLALGTQITNGNVHFRLAVSWCWKTLPTGTAGMGFTF